MRRMYYVYVVKAVLLVVKTFIRWNALQHVKHSADNCPKSYIYLILIDGVCARYKCKGDVNGTYRLTTKFGTFVAESHNDLEEASFFILKRTASYTATPHKLILRRDLNARSNVCTCTHPYTDSVTIGF